MVYTQMTIKALKYAYNAHSEQVDLNDIPYIFHPYHLTEQMDDEISCTVALLHDVVENTKITLEDLKPEFPHEVVEAVAISCVFFMLLFCSACGNTEIPFARPYR